METTELLLQPVVQYGFLGFSVVLLGVVIWLIKRLLAVLDANNRIIAANTEAINDLTRMTGDLHTPRWGPQACLTSSAGDSAASVTGSAPSWDRR